MSYIIKIASFLMLGLGAVNIIFLRLLNPSWWKSRYWRAAVMALPIIGVVSLTIWALGGPGNVLTPIRGAGRFAATMALVLEMGLTISLLLSGIVHTAAQVADSMAHREKPISPERRRFVGYAAAVFPAAALTGSVAGIATTFSPIAVPVRRLPVSGLPGPLIGLKIAHLSDLHLGFYVHLDDLEEVVKKIAVHKPDLVLFTGDICDDLQKLRQTLRIVDRLAPPFGIYASVGNHEYYRGIGRVLEIFRQAPFPILINESVPININGVSVHLGGADDPVHMRPDIADFMHGTIARTMRKAGNGAFRLLMSHRPQGLDHSADMGINLVLAGHTHGGQLGLGGRSLLEGLYPERYFWGIYHKGITTLHTSGGMGHWFPFRIGVPAEAPILVLEKG